MSEFKKLLAVSALASNLTLAGPGLDQAEVKLPYGELKSLVTEATRPAAQSRAADPTLLAAKFRLLMMAGRPVMDATFRTTTFADGLAKVPLVGGDITMENQNPADARVVIHGKMLCQALEKAGVQVLEMKLLPSFGPAGANLIVPACPAALFETGELGEEWSVAVKIDGKEQVLGSNRIMPLPIAGGGVEIRMMGGEETREALRPPEPSVWTWQNQSLVMPRDGEISYLVLGRASASGGSGVSALLSLPPDAREVRVEGEDLAGHKVIRGADRSLAMRMDWKTRGLLEREITISYQLPRRPLDRTWKLQSPAGPEKDSTLTRFIVVGSPEFTYAAEGLTGPFPPNKLSDRFTEQLKGTSCYQLEAADAVELSVSPLPLVETAEATVSEALWLLKLEPDGAMMVEGSLELEHHGMLGVILDVPLGMNLLSCDVGGRSETPVNLGDGKIEISLPATGVKSRISCSFTGRTAAFDPVEGTLELALPGTPLFIRALSWKIDLPRGYQAETHGNLVRVAGAADPPSVITLRKNLCRDERPRTHVFYQRANLGK